MNVITAPDSLDDLNLIQNSVSVFLAGGITNCPEWQTDVIGRLRNLEGGTPLTVYNPRRANFPIGNPDAAEQQITWEFNALDMCNIFSMWFCNAPSDQPICMYELGRNVATMYLEGAEEYICVGIEPGYKRECDVRKQLELALPDIETKIATTIEEHANNIILGARLWNQELIQPLMWE